MHLAAASKPSNPGAGLLGLLQGYRLEGFERSFKLVGGEILADRFLAGIHKADISPPALFSLCDKLGMPERFARSFRENAQDASAFHFGFEGSAGSGFVKVYLEYAHRLGQAGSHGACAAAPVLLHLAYKWDGVDTGKSAVARYECIPGLSNGDIASSVARLYAGQPGNDPSAAVTAILELAASRTQEALMYLEVREEDNPRASFDIKIHEAHLRIGEIRIRLATVSKVLNIPSGRLALLLAAIGDKEVGHLSGGIDRKGRRFLTVYYPAEFG